MLQEVGARISEGTDESTRNILDKAARSQLSQSVEPFIPSRSKKLYQSRLVNTVVERLQGCRQVNLALA